MKRDFQILSTRPFDYQIVNKGVWNGICRFHISSFPHVSGAFALSYCSLSIPIVLAVSMNLSMSLYFYYVIQSSLLVASCLVLILTEDYSMSLVRKQFY